MKAGRTAGRKPEEERREEKESKNLNDLLQDKQNFVRAKYERILQGVYDMYMILKYFKYHTLSFLILRPCALCTSFYTRADH